MQREICAAEHLMYRWLSSPGLAHQGHQHPGWISRQNVSLAMVLEWRALNFKFSYTFPLSGTGRQKKNGEGEKKAWETVSVEG